jgi:hypothetical protein
MQRTSSKSNRLLPRLIKALKQLVEETDLPFKLYLFIDGIDKEVNDDSEEISELFNCSTSATSRSVSPACRGRFSTVAL